MDLVLVFIKKTEKSVKFGLNHENLESMVARIFQLIATKTPRHEDYLKSLITHNFNFHFTTEFTENHRDDFFRR
jgi:hypothetical protein